MAARALTYNQVLEIYRRQIPTKWGSHYEPAMMELVREASTSSHTDRQWSTKLKRYVHTFSNPERCLVSLALIYPGTFELHEQHIHPPFPAPHPLAEHPNLAAIAPKAVTKGTVKIAQEMGMLSSHPKVFREHADGGVTWLAAPLIGDSRIFIIDELGPYCLEWDIKKNVGDHGRPGDGDWTERTSPRRMRLAELKYQIFREASRQLGIRVVDVALKQVDEMLYTNLSGLMRHSIFDLPVTPSEREDLEGQFREGMAEGSAPMKVINRYADGVIPRGEIARHVLEHALWERRIEIDLFSPWDIDWPLPPQKRVPWDGLLHWFER